MIKIWPHVKIFSPLWLCWLATALYSYVIAVLATLKPHEACCLHDQKKNGFFGGPAFLSANLNFLKTIQIALIGRQKSRPSKKATFVLIV